MNTATSLTSSALDWGGSSVIKDDADKFPRMEPCIERFEAGNLLGDRRGDARRFLFGDDLDIVQEKAEHTLVLEAPPELAYGFRVGVRLVGALPGWTVSKRTKGRMSSYRHWI